MGDVGGTDAGGDDRALRSGATVPRTRASEGMEGRRAVSEDESFELAEHEERLTALEAENAELRRVVNSLSKLVNKLTEDDAAETRFWWPGMTKSEASALWDRMMAWADKLTERYPNLLDAYKVRRCWYRHPEKLDVMTAIYANWVGNYGKAGPFYGPLDFQRKISDDLELVKRGMGVCTNDVCHLDKEEGSKSREQVKRELLATLPSSRVSGDDWD